MRITLDPWGSEYTSQMTASSSIDEENSSVQALEEQVEDRPWAPVTPSPASLPAVTAVVDGVMRTDASGMVSVADRSALALFGSFATGAVTIDSAVRIVHDSVTRLFIAGRNWPDTEDVTVAANGVAALRSVALCYAGTSSKAETYDQLRATLTEEMRQAEAQVAEALSGPDHLILADGNLTFFGGSSSVVGVIKTIYRMYLDSKKAEILSYLTPGQRTPLFRIVSGKKSDSYSVDTCYLRLARPQDIELPFAGLVRLEVKSSLRDKAIPLLDQAAVKVFELASRAPKDPRAPQNLIPIGGLERHLRHKLGDPQLVLRRIKNALRAMTQAGKEVSYG